jgi:hypothetical protein
VTHRSKHLTPPIPFVLLAALALAGCKTKGPPPPNEPPPTVAPAASDDPDEARLLGLKSATPSASASAPPPDTAGTAMGLRVGDALGQFTVGAVLPIAEGRLPVLVRAKQGEGVLEVALLGEGPLPPATSKRFAVYWRNDPTRSLPDALLNEAAQALAKRLEATEATLVPPPAMRAYGKVSPPGR